MHWFKLKRELATLDVVVVAVELGHGKRNQVLSDYTFAVREESTGELLPIGKAYSGLTDAEIAELTEHFKQNTIVDHGRYRRVKPNVVLEVAFNSIQPSTRHASGLALRFPRIKAIRRDKDVRSIDTLQYARTCQTFDKLTREFRQDSLTSDPKITLRRGRWTRRSSFRGGSCWLGTCPPEPPSFSVFPRSCVAFIRRASNSLVSITS